MKTAQGYWGGCIVDTSKKLLNIISQSNSFPQNLINSSPHPISLTETIGVIMYTSHLTKIYTTFLCIFISVLANTSFASCQNEPNNLISNCSFEIEGGNSTSAQGWSQTNSNTTRINSTSDAADGQHYIRLSTSNEINPADTEIRSDLIPVSAHSHIELTAKMKATDILLCGQETFPGYSSTCRGWHAGRLTLRYFDSSQLPITHRDANVTIGNLCANYNSEVCDWRHIQFTQTLPEGTTYVRVEAKLSKTIGTMLIDDVVLRVKQEVPVVDTTTVRKPVLMPTPKNIQYLNRTLPINNIAIIGTQVATKATAELQDFLKLNNFIPTLEPSQAELSNYDLVIYFGNG